MAPTLYQLPGSPPVRAVLMTAKSLGLELNLKQVDLFKNEHLTPEYGKINPQHTIPALVEDDGFAVWDSHAIMAYLVTVYGKDDSLYPKDPRKRAVIDQRLHFDSGIIFPRLLAVWRPILFLGKTTIDETDKNAVLAAYEILEKFLESSNSKWIAGDSLTIADFSLISTVSSLNLKIKVEPTRFPKLKTWLNNAEKLPEYQANLPGLKAVDALLTEKLGA